MIAAAMHEVRFEAAADFAAAVSALVLLEQCERATGRRWVTDADRDRVKDAAAAWTMVRLFAGAAETRRAAHRLRRRHGRFS